MRNKLTGNACNKTIQKLAMAVTIIHVYVNSKNEQSVTMQNLSEQERRFNDYLPLCGNQTHTSFFLLVHDRVVRIVF